MNKPKINSWISLEVEELASWETWRIHYAAPYLWTAFHDRVFPFLGSVSPASGAGTLTRSVRPSPLYERDAVRAYIEEVCREINAEVLAVEEKLSGMDFEAKEVRCGEDES